MVHNLEILRVIPVDEKTLEIQWCFREYEDAQDILNDC